MTKKKYFANYVVNNNTTLLNPIVDTSLIRVTKRIKEAAKGEIFCSLTNRGSFWVADETGNQIVIGDIFISKNLKPYTRLRTL